ncbi:MAG: hypothetical protein WCG04_06225 [Alphaproteobacteria bacterium]
MRSMPMNEDACFPGLLRCARNDGEMVNSNDGWGACVLFVIASAAKQSRNLNFCQLMAYS